MIVSLSCATVTYIVSSVMKTPKRARKCEVLINIVKEYAVTSHKLYAKLTSGVHTLEGVVDGVQRGMKGKGSRLTWSNRRIKPDTFQKTRPSNSSGIKMNRFLSDSGTT